MKKWIFIGGSIIVILILALLVFPSHRVEQGEEDLPEETEVGIMGQLYQSMINLSLASGGNWNTGPQL